MPLTVLIVDDHEGFRQAARALLEAAGIRVVGETVDGESAITERSGCGRSCLRFCCIQALTDRAAA